MSDPVLFNVTNGWGVITLNRPAALNALTLEMIRMIKPQLLAWRTDPAIQAVLITAAGEKAFCAGGDVVAIYQAIQEERRSGVEMSLTRDFFFEEYALNGLIAGFPKPYVALLGGITMGGGVGLSAMASHRVAGERYLYAMPETGIGLFPDVGGGWFLPRLPDQMGLYLALTGDRVGAGDALDLGLATHFVAAEQWSAMITDLQTCNWDQPAATVIDRVLARHQGPAPATKLAPHRGHIRQLFAASDFSQLWAAIDQDDSPLGVTLRQTLASKSPTSLRVSFVQLQNGAACDSIEQVLTMEYRLSQHSMAGHDFSEGVRALLVDKDKSPKWAPATVGEVSETLVEQFFSPIAGRELTWPDPQVGQ